MTGPELHGAALVHAERWSAWISLPRPVRGSSAAQDRRWLVERALYRLATWFEVAAYWLTMKRRKGNDDDDT